MDNVVDRVGAEKIVKGAIDDYIDIETLQQIINLIYGDEFLVVEDLVDEEEMGDY